MIKVSAQYALRAASQIQDTAYVLELPLSGTFLSTGPVRDLPAARQSLITRPGLIPTEVDPLGATASSGAVSVSALDLAGFLTSLRRAAPVRGQRALLWAGYHGLPFGRFLPAFPGRVSGFDLDASGLAYRIEVADALDRVDVPLFKEADIAAEPFTGGDKSFALGALVLRDTDEDGRYDTAILTGNPLTLLLQVLLSGGGNGGIYDVFPPFAAAGLTLDDVDVAWIEAERVQLLTVEEQYTYKGEVSAKELLEQDVCGALGGYPLVSGSGRIRVRFPFSPGALSPVLSVTDAHLVPGSLRWGERGENYLSHCVIDFDDAGDGSQTQLVKASPQFLASSDAEEREHPITARGLQTSLGGASVAESVAEALFARYGDAPPRIRFSTFFSRHLAEAGDVISFESRRYPDFDGRGVGSERLLEVLSVKPGPQKVDFDCLDLTGPITSGVRAVIAPNGLPAWTSASASDRRYAFLADAASRTMSTGAAAYVWG